jgi:hypothetical protein
MAGLPYAKGMPNYDGVGNAAFFNKLGSMGLIENIVKRVMAARTAESDDSRCLMRLDLGRGSRRPLAETAANQTEIRSTIFLVARFCRRS